MLCTAAINIVAQRGIDKVHSKEREERLKTNATLTNGGCSHEKGHDAHQLSDNLFDPYTMEAN